MTSINFIKTASPALHTALKRWYYISLLTCMTTIVAIISLQVRHMHILRITKQKHAILMHQKKEWDGILATQEKKSRQQKQLQEQLSLIQSIIAQQQRAATQIAALKKTMSDAKSTLQSLTITTNSTIAMTVQCSSPTGACALSQALTQIPTMRALQMTSLQPHNTAGKEAYLVTLKGSIR